MGFLGSLFRGLQDFAESDTAKRMMEKAEQKKAEDFARTTGKNGLRCSINNLVDNGHAVRCEGTVKNIGRSSYTFIKLNIVYKDKNGSVIDKKLVYANTNLELCPGESVPFDSISTAKNIHSASVNINSFDEV